MNPKPIAPGEVVMLNGHAFFRSKDGMKPVAEIFYEQQAKANEWQAKVIALAEEYVLSGAFREEYFRKKWELNS